MTREHERALDDARRAASTHARASRDDAPAHAAQQTRRGGGKEIASWARAAKAFANSSTSLASLRGSGARAREAHARCERAVYAALDYGDAETAEKLCEALEGRFGTTSIRARALRAATTLGKEGGAAEARKMLEEMLEENKGEARLRKMRVACAKSEGDVRGAVAALTEYLEDFGADDEAWLELGKLYAERCEYEKALFCYEEVLCARPFDPNSHRRMGEVLYTMGGEENIRDAKHHFAAAIDFTNGKDIRALYAVILCVKKLRIMSSKRGEEFKDKGALELADAATERLLQRYASDNETLLSIVRPLLKEAAQV